MGLYVRDGFIAEIANSIAGQHSDYDESNELPSVFAYNIAKYTAETVLPTEEQLIDCSKEIIAMIQLSGSKADPDNEEYVQSIADTLTGSLFPYFKPTAVQDPERGFELPDV